MNMITPPKYKFMLRYFVNFSRTRWFLQFCLYQRPALMRPKHFSLTINFLLFIKISSLDFSVFPARSHRTCGQHSGVISEKISVEVAVQCQGWGTPSGANKEPQRPPPGRAETFLG